MAEIVVEIPEELEREMKALPEIDWSEVAREFVRDEVYRLVRLKLIVSKSKFTEKDALELGKKINKGLARKYLESLKNQT